MSELGRHFLVGLSGETLSAQERKLLKALKPAGVIIFKHNLDSDLKLWPERLYALLAESRELCQRESFVVSIDHEGGRVHRMLPPVTHFPEARQWQKSSHAVGAAMGKELAALGFNVNFAPLFDVDLEPKNTVINRRAFSSDPAQVAQWGCEFLAGMEGEGVLGCAKHFPGHGATCADSHHELPLLDVDPETLRAREILPFQIAIDNGVSLVMTAHVVYSQLDCHNPATLSPVIGRELLRRELGFCGVLVSDALEMSALSGVGVSEMLSGGLAASVDLLLIAQPRGELPLVVMERFVAKLEKLLSVDSSLEQAFLESSARLTSLERKLKNNLDQMFCGIAQLGSLCLEHSELCSQL